MASLTLLDRAVAFTHGAFTPYAPQPAYLQALPPAAAPGPVAKAPATEDGTFLDTAKTPLKLAPQLPPAVTKPGVFVDAKKIAVPDADAAKLPQWAKNIDLLGMKYATLRDDPKMAEEFFAAIYKNTMEFTPIKDFIRKIEENPNIQVPNSYKKTSPDYRDVSVKDEAGKVTEEKYERIVPEILTAGQQSEDVKKWLGEATFIDVYNELFCTDLKDAALHQPAYKSYRTTALVLGVAGWAITAGIFALTASQMFHNGAVDIPSAEELVTRPLLTGLVLLSGAATLVSPVGGTRRSPVAQLVQGASELARMAVNGKLLDLVTPVAEYFRRDPANEFAAKHLSTWGTVKKYASAIVTRGQTGIIWELYKDVPDQYKWYKLISKQFKFTKGSLGSSGGRDQIDNVYSVAPGLMKYMPGSNRLIEAGLMFAWTAPVAVLAAVASGEDAPSALSTLGATAMLIGASTVVKTYFDRIKKENLMEALTYDQIVGFMATGVPALMTYLATHGVPAVENPLVYGGALAASALATMGAGWFIHKEAKSAGNGAEEPPAKAA